MSPLVTGLLSPWITGEKPGILAWVSAVLAVIGMVFIAQGGFETGHVMGLLFSLGVPFTFALQTLMQFWKLDPSQLRVVPGDAIYIESPLVRRRIPIDRRGEFNPGKSRRDESGRRSCRR